MDDCTGYIGLCHAGAYAGLHDAGIYAGYADNRNSKELVYCEKKRKPSAESGLVFWLCLW